MGIKALLKSILGLRKKNETTIMFESNTDFCDNTRAVFDHMIKNKYNEKYTLVWCVRNPKDFKDYKANNVYFTSFKKRSCLLSYLYWLSKTKYVFYTHIPPSLIPIKGQVIVNLWHGTPLKALTGYIEGCTRFDYVISTSPFVSDILLQCFNVPLTKIINTGYPRNDLLFENTQALKKLYINKDSYTKIILWMPTFRQSSIANIIDCNATPTGLPMLYSNELIQELNEKLMKLNQLMIIKLHPMQDELDITKTAYSNIKMLTNTELQTAKVQLYHLVAQADALLTDYSSIYFDYLMLNRPIGFIIDDIDQYKDKRGFVVDNPLDYMPGAHLTLPAQLYSFLDELNNGYDYFSDERKMIRKLVLSDCDNKSSMRFLESIGITK